MQSTALRRSCYGSHPGEAWPAGSDVGGERAASVYSLIGSAKLNAMDPEAYLREVLTRIADDPVNRIADLPPWNIVPTEPTHRVRHK
jgi:hypothetical protein